MQALLAAMRCEKGAIEANLGRHLQTVAQARLAGCELVVFPEMSLTGSVDPANHPQRLVTLDHPAIGALAAASAGSPLAICFGVAERAPDGRAHITQLIAADGGIAGLQRKRHLGDGEEAFCPAAGAAIVEHAGTRMGIAICAESGFDDPFDAAVAGGARLILFPAAPGLHGRRTDESSWRAGHAWWQGCGLADAQRHARRLGVWIAHAGQAGSAADEDFPGLAALIGPDGAVATRLPDWREGTLVVDIPV
jgi:predicted amidohydrolase